MGVNARLHFETMLALSHPDIRDPLLSSLFLNTLLPEV